VTFIGTADLRKSGCKDRVPPGPKRGPTLPPRHKAAVAVELGFVNSTVVLRQFTRLTCTGSMKVGWTVRAYGILSSAGQQIRAEVWGASMTNLCQNDQERTTARAQEVRVTTLGSDCRLGRSNLSKHSNFAKTICSNVTSPGFVLQEFCSHIARRLIDFDSFDFRCSVCCERYRGVCAFGFRSLNPR
jgi:hypothetical protein